MVERRKALVVRAVGDVVVVYFTDTKILEEMQIKWLGAELYDLVEKQRRSSIVINFQNVERFSTALLGKLVGLKKKAVEADGTVKLCCIPPRHHGDILRHGARCRVRDLRRRAGCDQELRVVDRLT